MKVTEEDGDPKLLKSGEMTPSQEAALSFMSAAGSHVDFSSLQKRNTSSTSPVVIDVGAESPLSLVKSGSVPFDPVRFVKMPAVFANTHSSTPVRFPPPALRPVDRIAGGPSTDDRNESESTGKKTTFKCKKCNFR